MDEMQRLQDDERELADRLEVYAGARLRPDPAAMARIRAELVVEASRRAAPPAGHRRGTWRVAIGLLAAAALLIGAVGTAAAGQAGGPLYGARLWVEAITLPADPGARADAESARLDARLAEIRAAVAARDMGAANAALEAYRSILDEAIASTPETPASTERLLASVGKHLVVLQSLLGQVPAPAVDALQNAIDRSGNGLRELQEHLANGGPGAQPTTPPGQASTPPGQASTPPGQQKTPPGQASTPPGQASTPPGPSNTPPGQASTPPGQASTPPGQQKTPPGQPSPSPSR